MTKIDFFSKGNFYEEIGKKGRKSSYNCVCLALRLGENHTPAVPREHKS